MSSERLTEVFDTVRALLLEAGYERLTFDAVAARARTSKATLYRQWGSKAGLVIAALKHQPPALADYTGATSIDEVFAQMARAGSTPTGDDLRLGFTLLHAASSDPDFGTELRKEIIAPAVDALVAIFEAAADRGEVVRDSPLFQRLAYLIIADFAFFPLISGRAEANAASRRELFRTIVRPALSFTDHSN